MTDAERMLIEFEGAGPMRGGMHVPYADSLGVLTIGYGHNLEHGIPHDIVLMLFYGDMAKALDAVHANISDACYDALSRPRQLVCISMGFQFGKAGLAKWPHFLSALHAGQYEVAAEALLDSKVAKEQAPGRFTTLATMMRNSTSKWV